MSDIDDGIRSAHAEAPWRERDDWARGVVADSSGQFSANERKFFSFLLLVLGLPMGLVLWEELPEYDPRLVWLALVPPALALAFLVRSVVVISSMKRDATRFELATLPGVVGGFLRGTVRTKRPLHTAAELRFQLVCYDIASGEGRATGAFSRRMAQRRAVVKETLHVEEGRIPVGDVRSEAGECALPVEVGIPYTCPQTRSSGEGPRIGWHLIVSAEMPTGSTEMWFDVPVYRTADSDPDYVVSTTPERSRRVAESVFESKPEHAGVRVTESPGSMRFYFGPARMRQAAVVITVFTAVMCALTVGLHLADVHRVIVAALGLFSVLLLYGTLHIWLAISVVRIERGWLLARTGILGIGVPRRIPFRDIDTIEAVERGNQQEGLSYNLVAVRKSGRDLILARYLADRDHARWLAAKMLARAGRV